MPKPKGWKTPQEVKDKISLSNKGRMSGFLGKHHTIEFRIMIGNIHRGKIVSIETRHKMSLHHRGIGFSGKHHTEETKLLIANNEERNRKIGLGNKGIPKPGKENAIKGALKISNHRKRDWQNPEYSRKILSKLCSHPNKPESLLGELIEMVCPNEYKFTGDGTVTINNLHPDYTNCNSQKKVIEMFGDYYHRNENPQDKIDKYAEFGFDCLVIWEHELREPDRVKERIIDFCKS